MGKKRCRGDDDDDDLLRLLPPPFWEDDDLIQKILVWLPVKSLLRFKSVCKSWRQLIESSFFIDFHTTTTCNSSSSKFGSFVLLASVDKRSSECALLMLSSSESGSLYRSKSGPGSGNWWWSTGSDDISCRSSSRVGDEEEEEDDQVFKVVVDDDEVVFKLDNLGFPPCYQFYFGCCNLEIIGSCNGLVCLRHYILDEVSLWNPATSEFRILPQWVPYDAEEPTRDLIAFGFDVKTKDYKVVLVHCYESDYYRPECPCRVQVYSLSTNSWRLLEGITCLPGNPFFNGINSWRLLEGITCLPGNPFFNGIRVQVLYLNGSCFFMAHFLHTREQPRDPENDRFIISFDFTKEIITPMQLPDHHQDQKLYLSCLGDKIALFTVACYSNDDDTWNTYEDFNSGICSEFFNIWVLNEYCGGGGSSSNSSMNKGSWTILYSFQMKSKIPGQWNIPRGISNDGEFALLETKYSSRVGKKMKLYNLATKQVKKNFLSCSAVMSNAIAYKPSLVSIIGGNGCSSSR